MQGTTRGKKRGAKAARPRVARGAAPLAQRNSTLSRWGNSLGLRIPREAADRLNLKAGARVSVELRADSITIRPVRKRRIWTEADLLKGVAPEMLGGEVDWGPPVGKEVW
jgi:antitoxin MazE